MLSWLVTFLIKQKSKTPHFHIASHSPSGCQSIRQRRTQQPLDKCYAFIDAIKKTNTLSIKSPDRFLHQSGLFLKGIFSSGLNVMASASFHRLLFCQLINVANHKCVFSLVRNFGNCLNDLEELNVFIVFHKFRSIF